MPGNCFFFFFLPLPQEGLSLRLVSNALTCLCCSAKELELEDRQSRLQQDLRRRMATEGESDHHLIVCAFPPLFSIYLATLVQFKQHNAEPGDTRGAWCFITMATTRIIQVFRVIHTTSLQYKTLTVLGFYKLVLTNTV